MHCIMLDQFKNMSKCFVIAIASIAGSDILTPLPAMGVAFDIDDNKGPVIDAPIKGKEGLKTLHTLELNRLSFVGE